MKRKRIYRFFMSLLALAFPWVVHLIDDNPIAALVCLALQASVIGWIPASIWAWRVVHRPIEQVS